MRSSLRCVLLLRKTMTPPSANKLQTQLQILTAVVKLFLKTPDAAQSLVQKVLQAATSSSDNPDLRDRAYVYWRLLSSDPQIAKSIVLSPRPQITSTIPVLPPALLETLLPNLSTLASVYHKPPQSFLGKGRSSALQAAAIEEAREEARENPIAASAVSAAVAGKNSGPALTAENLLDIDFDGAAPASSQKGPIAGLTGLEGLAGTPQRVASPTGSAGGFGSGYGNGTGAASGGVNDLMGMFGNDGAAAAVAAVGQGGFGAEEDLMNGFAGLGMNGAQSQSQTQPDVQTAKKTNEDLLGLF